MLALLAMARCAGVCGVDTTKAGNVLSGERCDLRNVLCGKVARHAVGARKHDCALV